ncbi:MAG: hypothetical protein ABJA67_15540 [Chthonomonadales bacterium]
MKSAYIKHLVNKYVDPHFSGYKLSGCLYHREPIEYVLNGYCFGSGRGADILNLDRIVQPMYIPFDSIALSLSKRVMYTCVSKENEEQLMPGIVDKMKSLEPFFYELTTPGYLTYLTKYTEYEDNSDYDCQRRAYSRILNGEYALAKTQLKSLVDELEQRVRDNTARIWHGDMIERAQELIRFLDINPQLAVDKLNEYTAYTKNCLRLP